MQAATHRTGQASTSTTRPKVREYRVHSELTLDLGTGVSGSVNGTESFTCVNANGGFAFKTPKDQDVHDLWIDASESVIPPCFSVKSYQYFRVNVTGPYAGNVQVELAEEEDGKAGRSDYHLTCPHSTAYHLACTQTGPLAAKITCVPEPLAPACVDTSSNPKIDCVRIVHLRLGEQVTNQHICTSTGDPLPQVTTEQDPLPQGLTYKRWPTDKDTWIVINGKVGGSWGTKIVTFVAAPTVAATVDFDVSS